jgi:tRNA(fMet)-specific endonuclease VapC
MIYLPDTNVWIRLLNKGDNLVKKKFEEVDPSEIRLCSVVKAELYFGAEKSQRRDENMATIEALFSDMESLSFDDLAAKQYGVIRKNLSTSGVLIGPNDLMIAAIGLVHDITVVTHNTREFSRVSGLRIEDWET